MTSEQVRTKGIFDTLTIIRDLRQKKTHTASMERLYRQHVLDEDSAETWYAFLTNFGLRRADFMDRRRDKRRGWLASLKPEYIDMEWDEVKKHVFHAYREDAYYSWE